ncbi:MAG TPA: DUF3576 domain-containing protein [Caulobacteraceae bacterium]|jgi:hypothetical protein
MSFIRGASVLLIASSVLLSACGMGRHASADGGEPVYVEGESHGMFGHMFHKKHVQASSQAGIGVNSYLWRATLDTLSFMPLGSADPWGGVIATEWYTNPEKPDERFKTTVYILDTRLRADALNVTVFKQVRDASGNWVDSAVSAQTETDLENSILTKARQLRLANVGN